MWTSKQIKEINRRRYEEDYTYSRLSINRSANGIALVPVIHGNEKDYFEKMFQFRLRLIKKYGQGKKVLDLCCGTGDYLFAMRDIIQEGIGVDFSKKMLNNAVSKRNEKKAENLYFIQGNARQIPCFDVTFDLIYSFSSLYYIPEVGQVALEVGRLLKPDSIAIFEFGNLYSINTLVCWAYPDWGIPCHIKIKDMKKIIKDAGLGIVEWRRFQLFPLWGNKPWWLKPLLHPLWKKVLQKEINGRMLDEWICSIPLIKCFAFRHTIICKKIDI